MTHTPLSVSDENPVDLTGILDSSSDLQLVHDQSRLVNHSQVLHAKHDSLRASGETIRVKLLDFVSGGIDWQVTATHDDENGNPVGWTRKTDHSFQDFAAMTDAIEITVTATEGGPSGHAKTRKVWIKTMPKSAQPDHP